ncbi:MAG: methylmalonyl Co-A mutase-associated GTPase MeaB [Desulfobacterales bacterium]|nr:MAG: methylmalonyl Co-A mutase-associated GTPase MeaB [Desulfobacterales bacterium]
MDIEENKNETRKNNRAEMSAFNALPNESIVLIRKKTNAFVGEYGRRPRVLVTGVDQKVHGRTTRWFASLFSEMGFDVDISLLQQTPRLVAKTAVENDVDFICVASPDTVSPSLISHLADALDAHNKEDILIIAGSENPPEDDHPLVRAGATGIVNIHRLVGDMDNWLAQVKAGMDVSQDPQHYVKGVIDQDRRTIAKAITLIESALPAHQKTAQSIINQLIPLSGNAIRIGVSGVPGVGKSSFIESFGIMLIKKGYHLAVLAVDPSSSRSGGSILGDKTRMQGLSMEPHVFIRPSPTGGTLGGVARKTRETMVVCEAAGFDVIIVETVGVGQSEIAVSSMVDFFLVMLIAGAGDEIQGLKRGIIEFADAIAINKADGDNIQKAKEAKMDYQSALSVLCPPSRVWSPPVLTCSAHTMDGVDTIWEIILDHREKLAASGELNEKRRKQSIDWMWDLVEEGLIDRFYKHSKVIKLLPKMIEEVETGKTIASAALHKLLSQFKLDLD